MINNREKQYWENLKKELSFYAPFAFPPEEEIPQIHHIPIMRGEIFFYFKEVLSTAGSLYIDGTLGEGGHTEFFLETFPSLNVLALDQDENILKKAALRLYKYKERLSLYHSNYYNIAHIVERNLQNNKFDRPNAILLDLGISSYHIDEADRGFSFRDKDVLDMRLGSYLNLRAADILTKFTEKEIADIIFQYGEEGRSRRIASAIVKNRSKTDFSNPENLASLMQKLIPTPSRKRHPAVKIFQALRIYINQELNVLSESLPSILNCLAPGGILAVISFHSLEDRIVKNIFKEFKSNKHFKILTKKPISPSENEYRENSRSGSAKLRVIQKSEDFE